MAGDTPQPCGDVSLALEPMQIAVQLEEDVLRYFFCRAGVAEDAEGDRKDTSLMAL